MREIKSRTWFYKFMDKYYLEFLLTIALIVGIGCILTCQMGGCNLR